MFSHPDDAELTVGGTLIKLKSLGYKTGVIDLTRGEMGTRGTPETRARESQDAAGVLGLDARSNLGLPDGHVMVTEEARTAMVRAIRRHGPKVIFTSHWTIRSDPAGHALLCANRPAGHQRRYDEKRLEP